MVTSGFATRFRYHDGCAGAPPLEATTTIRSPSSGTAAAIETWRWLEDRIGCWNVYPGWFERVPQGEDHRGRGEVVNDGLCSDPRGAKRLLHAWRSATKAQWERSIVGGTRTDYPVYSLDEYLALDDEPTEPPIPADPARDGRPQREAA